MKKVLIGLLVVIIIGFGVFAKYLIDRASIFTGFAAKNVASGIFVAGRTQQSIEALDINFFPVNLARTVVDYKNKTVTSDFFGFGKQIALFRPNLGCFLLGDMPVGDLPKQELIMPDFDEVSGFWPFGNIMRDTSLAFVNEEKLKTAMQKSLAQGNTRAILVAYDTLLMWETYGDGFNQSTPILGWSMSKSITNAMIGILIKQGKLKLDEPAPIDEWKNDDRAKITLRQLLNMTSGLKWVEDYGDISEATIMLYEKGDIAKYAIQASLAFPVDSVWYYSSGTSNILSEIVKRQFSSLSEYWLFPHKSIFQRIGMQHTIMETDAAGLFVGSSYTYAPARDWARFGLLYLQNGIWSKDTILDPSWVDFTKSEAPNSKGEYGAQFWLNKSGIELPDAPRDIYFADGYQGQRIYIIPSKKLVVVRFGISKAGEFDYNQLVTSVIKAFE
jgi:CubicO group peptidase (beta-lactamase class C family)